MANKLDREPDAGTIKDPEKWTTGAEPMTGAQDSYLHTLAREAGEPVDEKLTKAEASKRIEDLQQKTGRGVAPAARKSRRGRGARKGSSSNR